jgi:hypothetical protein
LAAADRHAQGVVLLDLELVAIATAATVKSLRPRRQPAVSVEGLARGIFLVEQRPDSRYRYGHDLH